MWRSQVVVARVGLGARMVAAMQGRLGGETVMESALSTLVDL